jgi:hypothetical protein
MGLTVPLNTIHYPHPSIHPLGLKNDGGEMQHPHFISPLKLSFFFLAMAMNVQSFCCLHLNKDHHRNGLCTCNHFWIGFRGYFWKTLFQHSRGNTTAILCPEGKHGQLRKKNVKRAHSLFKVFSLYMNVQVVTIRVEKNGGVNSSQFGGEMEKNVLYFGDWEWLDGMTMTMTMAMAIVHS